MQGYVGHVYNICISTQVRDSLEKVRERMYGQFGGMQQSMQKLSNELRVKKLEQLGRPIKFSLCKSFE